MNLEELASKYIGATEIVLKEMERVREPIALTSECVDNIIGYVKAYLKDAKYYSEKKKFETSLTSVAYCEGLLDALKLIGAIKIAHPPK
jgi:hypothetical protein